MNLTDQQVLDIVDTLLVHDSVPPGDRVRRVRQRSSGIAGLRALGPLFDRYLAIVDPPRTCQVEHDHWEGKLICGNPLPCARHGGR